MWLLDILRQSAILGNPRSPDMRIRTIIPLVALGIAACGTKDNTEGTDSLSMEAGEASNNAVTEQSVRSPDGSFSVLLPARWAGVYRVDTLSTAERGLARPGALNIIYLPNDSSVIPQTLVVIAVYDSAAWVGVKADGGPPPGDSVFAKNGRVYMLGLPQSNPFVPGTVDAFTFDSLALTEAEKARIILVP